MFVKLGKKCRIDSSTIAKTILTICVEAFLKDFLNCILCCFQSVFLPGLAIVRTEDNNLAFLAAKGGKVGHLDDHGTEKKGKTRPLLDRFCAVLRQKGALG